MLSARLVQANKQPWKAEVMLLAEARKEDIQTLDTVHLQWCQSCIFQTVVKSKNDDIAILPRAFCSHYILDYFQTVHCIEGQSMNNIDNHRLDIQCLAVVSKTFFQSISGHLFMKSFYLKLQFLEGIYILQSYLSYTLHSDKTIQDFMVLSRVNLYGIINL